MHPQATCHCITLGTGRGLSKFRPVLLLNSSCQVSLQGGCCLSLTLCWRSSGAGGEPLSLYSVQTKAGDEDDGDKDHDSQVNNSRHLLSAYSVQSVLSDLQLSP